MHRAFRGYWVVLMASLSACQAAEPVPEKESAAIEKVVAASGQATRKGDWDAFAALIHPDSLQDFKALFVPVLQAAAKKGGDEQADLLTLFDGAKDLKTVLAWQPKEFFARFAKGYTSRAPLKETFASTTSTVLGMVPEGSDQVHVVVRATRTIEKAKISRVDVVTLKRSGREWKMLLPSELRVVAETIKRLGTPGHDSGTSKDVDIPADPDKPQPAKIKELMIGKWEDPTRPGNWWEFDRDGDFIASIRQGVIRCNTKGTYRILADGSLDMTIKVFDQTSEPVKFKVKVTKKRLTFVDEKGKEDSYQRAK
jgi:uncharacterized protein (TIGR03066 family)